MEKEFVPYEQARDLKELGFDEYCLGLYSYASRNTIDMQHVIHTCKASSKLIWMRVPTPTYSQAFKWFRKKHGIHSFIDIYPQPDEPERCWYMLRYFERGEKGKEDYMSGWFINQDKAELACLKKLIEIVKEKK